MQITDEMVDRALDNWLGDIDGDLKDRTIKRLRPDMRRALAAALTTSPPAGVGTVEVRVAVAFSEDGQIAAVDTIYFGQDETAWKALAQEGAVLRSCIATIPAPLPAVAEVRAQVQPAGEG